MQLALNVKEHKHLLSTVMEVVISNKERAVDGFSQQ